MLLFNDDVKQSAFFANIGLFGDTDLGDPDNTGRLPYSVSILSNLTSNQDAAFASRRMIWGSLSKMMK